MKDREGEKDEMIKRVYVWGGEGVGRSGNTIPLAN